MITIEELKELMDLVIWMSGAVAFSDDQLKLFAKGLDFLQNEIKRRSVADEEINEAIAKVQVMVKDAEYFVNHKELRYEMRMLWAREMKQGRLIIDALRAYMKPEPCEWCKKNDDEASHMKKEG